MAITHNSEVLVITAQMTDLLSIEAPTFKRPIRINTIYWYNEAGTIGQKFVIEDADAFTILPGRVEDDAHSQWFPLGGKAINDFKVSTLDSGVLYIYFDRKHAAQ